MAKAQNTDQTTASTEAPIDDVTNAEADTEAQAAPLAQEAAAEGQAQPSTSGEAPASPEAATDPVSIGRTITVTCLSTGGRRRAGRDWPQGATIAPADDLTAYQVEQLRGDPRFRVGSDADLPCEGC